MHWEKGHLPGLRPWDLGAGSWGAGGQLADHAGEKAGRQRAGRRRRAGAAGGLAACVSVTSGARWALNRVDCCVPCSSAVCHLSVKQKLSHRGGWTLPAL